MSSGSWLRRNLTLVAGIALPLLVILFFLLATAIPRWLVEPPGYDLVFADTTPYPIDTTLSQTLSFAVEDGRVVGRTRRLAENQHRRPNRLLILDHESLSVRSLEVETPPVGEEDDSELTFPIPELADIAVLTERVAPDGYEFSEVDRGGVDLFGGLFGVRRYRAGYAIEKGGRRIPVSPPEEDRYPYYTSLEFLGWVVDEDTGR